MNVSETRLCEKKQTGFKVLVSMETKNSRLRLYFSAFICKYTFLLNPKLVLNVFKRELYKWIYIDQLFFPKLFLILSAYFITETHIKT